MSEKTEYQWLREKIVWSPNRIERIENLIAPGTFDCNYCLWGDEGWLEIKAPTEPKRPSTPLLGSNHKVSQDQANWALAQRRAGGRALFWFGTDKRRMLLPGSLADNLNHMTVDELLAEALWVRPRGHKMASQDREELLHWMRS
jgi:hypothetical protein